MKPQDRDSVKPTNVNDLTRRRTGKERVLIAFFIGCIIAACITLFGLELLADKIVYLIVGFIALALLLGAIFFFVTLNKEWTFRKVFGASEGDISDVKDSLKGLATSLLTQNKAGIEENFESTFQKAAAWYVWNSYRRWVIRVFYTLFLGFAGLLGSVMVYNQNKLIESQNTIVESQTKLLGQQTELLDQQTDLLAKQSFRIDQQTNLLEADRRSSLVFLFSNVLDAIDKEISEDYGIKGSRDLSDQLIARIVSLANSLKPYSYLENDSLISKPISPERGQLLLSLLESKLDNRSYEKIFEKANFQYSYMENVKLVNHNLDGIDLKYANFSKSDISFCSFIDSDLDYADFSNSSVQYCNLSRVSVDHTNFKTCRLDEIYCDHQTSPYDGYFSLHSGSDVILPDVKSLVWHWHPDFFRFGKRYHVRKQNIHIDTSFLSWEMFMDFQHEIKDYREERYIKMKDSRKQTRLSEVGYKTYISWNYNNRNRIVALAMMAPIDAMGNNVSQDAIFVNHSHQEGRPKGSSKGIVIGLGDTHSQLADSIYLSDDRCLMLKMGIPLSSWRHFYEEEKDLVKCGGIYFGEHEKDLKIKICLDPQNLKYKVNIYLDDVWYFVADSYRGAFEFFDKKLPCIINSDEEK